MKFAHLADCHLGGWAEPKMRELNTKSFIKTVDRCISENVDFILISGDLFNTSLPAIDILKTTVHKLRQLRKNNIPVYIISGSHDFSPTGKTMIDVLAEAGLCINVVRGRVENEKLKLEFTVDKKTGAKITGMIGKRGMLERSYYDSLDLKSLEKEEGYKIFMFHTALTELKPKELEKMDSAPISMLPRCFDYYAGGHVHIVKEANLEGYRNVVYPGPLFPNNFRELEVLKGGSFYIVEDNKPGFVPIILHEIISININCKNRPVEIIEQELDSEIKKNDFKDKIVLIRLSGTLSNGRQSDINFKEIFNRIYEKGAYFIMKNTSSLRAVELEEIKISRTAEDIESKLISEHLGQLNMMEPDKEEKITKMLISGLDTEKQEGEKVHDFEARVNEEMDKILG